ncbi:hypothetical protein BDQ12DRAFT_768249 [Crucibulum laeve]|uniref:ARM repeat-containing protein n=1 Tax=Crucibulum laeve TaxID=68775 RepID=A0A5C3M7L6_9AGAR|nr:hypothetical protein BDQ12DRAFT_768249 [Crucibulum laeve]
MEDDEISFSSTGEVSEQSAYDKQRASLQTYLDALPYECESIDEMQQRLEEIVAKLYIAAKAKNWLVLSTWDGMLQCWLLMRYPMPKTTRAKLVRFYYELCLLPGIEARVMRSWADMLSRLIANKQGVKRKLEASDLQLPWQPLWRILQKELRPREYVYDSTRNVANILLYVAEQCRRYFPASEIPEMLDTFIPRLTKESLLTMVPVLTSFLPPTHTHLYLPALFKIWEAFNSSIIDDRLLEIMGDLSEEHVAGAAGDSEGEGGAQWHDVGIWTQAQWNFLVGKGLGSMSMSIHRLKMCRLQGASTTGAHADSMDKSGTKIKKTINRINAIAKVLVYAMCVDGEVRDNSAPATRVRSDQIPRQKGFVAGSKAVDSLDRLITSTESFFHPSNAGHWTPSLTQLLQRLSAEFAKRWNEEQIEACKTPINHRLTPGIKRAFVTILRTPALLAMFSKDPICMSFAQGALRSLSMLEPNLIMPELLERAYGGLEIVNETHRTTAVMSMLAGIARPLVCEKIWLGGQKHILPLLELCIPGIDLNDPVKTVCATMFIVATIQHLKIGDLSQSRMDLSGDPGEDMDVDEPYDHLPDGTDMGDTPRLSREDERALVRDSTASFADWVTSLFRRVLALYENLPEEGGRRNTTGGKQEESVLKSIKSMLDVVCLHLSDSLFDLVLNLVFDYATTNAKSNAVRAFGQLIACLARLNPEKTMARFLPFCISQIGEELKHGASSVRTTSTHAAVASDTTFHWNLSILRGCLGYGGPILLKYKQQILSLMVLLVERSKSERGYTGIARLITRILNTVGGVYPLNSRFVNTDEWEDPQFDQSHNLSWGKLYEPQDVVVEWHVPSQEEVAFILDILHQIERPCLDKVEGLLARTAKWNNVDRNDFCRYLHAARAVWLGLPGFLKEQSKEVVNQCINPEFEIPDMIMSHLDVNAGFTLTDPNDPRYQTVAALRQRYGQILHNAAVSLRGGTEGEDHIDAVLSVTRAIDTYMLAYGMNRSDFDAMQKNYAQARDLNRSWSKQKDNSRLVFVKRAHVYHSGRLYMHALYRRRSELDDTLLCDLVELSLSPYTRIRRQAQVVLHNVCGYYIRSTRYILPTLFDALAKGNDADRMKGALYVLWNKGIDHNHNNRYLVSLLECQHEEKPSIQKLVNSLAQDSLGHLNEEVVNTDAYALPTPGVEQALEDLAQEFSPSFIDSKLLQESVAKAEIRIARRAEIYNDTVHNICTSSYFKQVSSILEVASRPTTHWRYVQMASRFLSGLLRRDVPTSAPVARFLLEQSLSPQPTIRVHMQKAAVKMFEFIKMRTYSKSAEELWLEEWSNPLQKEISIADLAQFLSSLQQPVTARFVFCVKQCGYYIDKIETGFLSWTRSIKAYRPPVEGSPPIIWETQSHPCLQACYDVISKEDYIKNLAILWSQESNKGGSIDMRPENVVFIKRLAKIFETHSAEATLTVVDSLVFDSDKFKQRAGGEILVGLLRGSKHWAQSSSAKLWEWTGSRLNRILAQIKPETLSFWESVFQYQLYDRDPRRSKVLVDWILSLSLDFSGDSAFEMNKPLALFSVLVESIGIYFNPHSDQYVNLLLDNANTSYAEMRQHICQGLYSVTKTRWQPWYPSTEAFLTACGESQDPLHIRDAWFLDRVNKILERLPKWREERLPPPRSTHSEYDKVGLTLLQWIWVSAHGPHACLIFPYIVPMMPEILRMSELNDSPEMQAYSSGVLYILSAVVPPVEYIEAIVENFVTAIKSSTSWRIRLHALPALVVFFYRNLLSISQDGVAKVMDVLLDCLADENVEVRSMTSKVLSGVVRCSQRQSIVPLKNRFVALARKTNLPPRRDPAYADSLRSLHSAILGICALIESLPYSVEPWMPSLTEVLAPHATDPPPISTTIRDCASEFKKTHQDTWHKDQLLFDDDQLQSLSTMLVGTSYCKHFRLSNIGPG